jgi:intracellular sulfur oxidation DsrE/DsrF family protein
MKYLSLILVLSFASLGGNAQTASPSADSAARVHKDSMRMQLLFSKAAYPLIKSNKWTGVLPVENITEVPDPKMVYKMLMEDVFPVKDSIAAKEANGGLAEIGRIINLHVASGIPKNKLDVVVVVHGPALYALYTNEQYRKKWGIDNPNIPLINELMHNGVRFIACGQAMQFFDVRREEMVPNIKISLTAQTVLSAYQLKGYIWYPITEEK